jgi:histidine triad (HIT) family protein
MAGSIFSKIIAGEIPCQKVFENEHVLAFLDINPLAEGHTLVIPKREVAQLDALSDDEAAEVGRALRRVAAAVSQTIGSAGYNVLQNNGAVSGQEVMHVHFHIIPRRAGDGLGYRWKPQPGDPDALAALAERIRAAV